MQSLVGENAKLAMEHERIEHEMELMTIDLDKAHNKIEQLELKYEDAVCGEAGNSELPKG